MNNPIGIGFASRQIADSKRRNRNRMIGLLLMIVLVGIISGCNQSDAGKDFMSSNNLTERDMGNGVICYTYFGRAISCIKVKND